MTIHSILSNAGPVACSRRVPASIGDTVTLNCTYYDPSSSDRAVPFWLINGQTHRCRTQGSLCNIRDFSLKLENITEAHNDNRYVCRTARENISEEYHIIIGNGNQSTSGKY